MSSAQSHDRDGLEAGDLRPDTRLPEGFLEEFAAAATAHDRDRVVGEYFDLKPVGSEQDIRPDAVYYARDKQRQLLSILPDESSSDLHRLTFLPSSRRTKPIAGAKLLELGAMGRLLRLAPKATAGPDPSKICPDCAIDMGTLTQLLTAARQSGIVSNVDQIARVRDCEFRMGKYKRAFEVIERMWVKFGQSLAQRQNRLRTEETRYRAGTLKMSPKQWQMKKQRDTTQSQNIERARRKFARVLDGLRLLARSM